MARTAHSAPPRRPAASASEPKAKEAVGRWITAEQRDDYQPWVDNSRRLRELVTRLEALGEASLDPDPRNTARPAPTPVDSARSRRR